MIQSYVFVWNKWLLLTPLVLCRHLKMQASVKVRHTLMLTRKELTLLSPRNLVLHVWHLVADFTMLKEQWI